MSRIVAPIGLAETNETHSLISQLSYNINANFTQLYAQLMGGDAGNLASVSWGGITSIPTTIAGYGILDFAESVDDRVFGLLVAGTNITFAYNDPANTLTINASGGGAGTDLTYNAGTRLLSSSTGADVTLPLVAADAGLMAAADKTKLDAITGTNTGDQTTIAGISGTKAQFNTAVSDGDILYVGDAPTAHTHLLAAGATDVTMTAANLNALDDGVNTALHFHDADRARANHTGTQAVGTITGLAAIAT